MEWQNRNKKKQKKYGWKKKEKKEQEKKKQEKGKAMEIKKVAEEWEIWDDKEKAARSEKEVRKLVPEPFYKWIQVFGKKASERMPMRKIWDHTIDLKKEFMPKKRKIYPLST